MRSLVRAPASLVAPVTAIVAVTLAATSVMLAAPGRDLARVLPVEDGFYTLSVAREIGLGHGITVDGVTATNGFQPLWAFVVAPFAWLAGGDRTGTLRWALVLGTLLWLAFVPLVALIARTRARAAGLRGDVAAAVAAIVAAGSVSVVRIFHNGLETGLLLAILAAAVLALDRVRVWTAWRAAALGLGFGALIWARLDAVAFVGAAGVIAAWRARATGRAWVLPLAAAALGGALIVPWLVRNVALDGSVVPTSGRAEARHGAPWTPNADAMLRAVGAWALAPGFRPSMHRVSVPWTELLSLAGAGIVAAAWWRLRRARLGTGTSALAVYCAFLAIYYTFSSGAWWFADRYLAPALLLFIPALAAAGEALARGSRARLLAAGLAALVLALNVPLLAVLAAAPTRLPPAWASAASNLATHPNVNVEQVAWAAAHVRPACRIGAFESGTLGYYRDGVTNLDGKMDDAALDARLAGRSTAFVRAKGIGLVIDIPSGVERATGPPPRLAWQQVAENMGRFDVWVRRDRAAQCLR